MTLYSPFEFLDLNRHIRLVGSSNMTFQVHHHPPQMSDGKLDLRPTSTQCSCCFVASLDRCVRVVDMVRYPRLCLAVTRNVLNLIQIIDGETG